MTTLKNKLGDEVTVDIGSFGGDNVFGHVTDKDGAPVAKARVKVINLSNDQEGVEKVGNDGEYDIDVDAKPGDKVYVHVEWKDETGKWHVVTGIVTLKAEDDSSETDLSEKYAKIDMLEKQAHRLLLQSDGINTAVVQLYELIQTDLFKYVNSVSKIDNTDQQKKEIDKAITQELYNLHNKFKHARDSKSIPPPEQQWAMLEELWNLILKMVGKLFLLQNMPIPEMPPAPGGDLT